MSTSSQSYSDIEGSSVSEDDREEKTIRVVGVNPCISKDILTLFLENYRRSKGGRIEDIQINRERQEAFVTFRKPEVADRVLSKRQLILGYQMLQVYPLAYRRLTRCTRRVKVTGFNPITSQLAVWLYFENNRKNRSNGREIEDLIYIPEKLTAIITFEEDRVAERVVKNKRLILEGASLSATFLEDDDELSDYDDNIENEEYSDDENTEEKRFQCQAFMDYPGDINDVIKGDFETNDENRFREDESRPSEINAPSTGVNYISPFTFAQPKPDRLSVVISQNDIRSQQVDVIVNPTSDETMQDRGFCTAIAAAGGEQLEKECSDYIAKYGSVEPGEFFVTGSGNLNCRYVIHTVIPKIDDCPTNDSYVERIQKLFYLCMDRANKPKSVKTVAFPLVSEGMTGYDAIPDTELLSQGLCHAITEFCEATENQHERLITIYINCQHETACNYMIDLLRKENSSETLYSITTQERTE